MAATLATRSVVGARAAAHVAADPKLSIAAVVLLGGPLAAMGAMEAAGLRSRVARAEAPHAWQQKAFSASPITPGRCHWLFCV